MTNQEFTDAYTKGFGRTMALLRSMQVSVNEAEEIAQWSWARAWEKRDNYQGRDGCSFLTWVCHIARNRCIYLFRLNKMRQHRSEPLAQLISHQAPSDTSVLATQVLEAVPVKQRKMLTLYMYGYSSDEVGKLCGYRVTQRVNGRLADSPGARCAIYRAIRLARKAVGAPA